MRPAIYNIKGNHSTLTPSQIVVFDTETNHHTSSTAGKVTQLRFRLGAAITWRQEGSSTSRREVFQFTKLDDWWQWLESMQDIRRRVWVFAHNLQFDLKVCQFWTRFEQGEYTTGPLEKGDARLGSEKSKRWQGKLVLEGRPTFLYCMGRKGKVNFIDSCNFFPQSLAKLGQEMGFEKSAIDFEQADLDQLGKYCLRDCEVLEKAIATLLGKWSIDRLGVWQPTAPLCAMQSWRHMQEMDAERKPVWPVTINPDKEPTELERAGYYGGYTCCFYKGAISPVPDDPSTTAEDAMASEPFGIQGPVYQLDVQSFYGGMMRFNVFPRKRVFYYRKCSLNQLIDLFPLYPAIASVRIDDAVNPHIRRSQAGLQYVRGSYWTVLAGPELERALVLGSVAEVGQACFYLVAPIFEKWVDYWASRLETSRTKGDAHDATYCKMILVGLSGKWAQLGARWVERNDVCPEVDWGEWISAKATRLPDGTVQMNASKFRRIGGTVQEYQEGDGGPTTFPAISAFITAYGREFMRRFVASCPERSVYYQATDCVFGDIRMVLEAEKQGLVAENKVGRFKPAVSAAGAEFIASNWYRFGSRVVRSGHWGNARLMPDGSYVYDAWEGVSSVTKVRPDDAVKVQSIRLKFSFGTEKMDRAETGWGETPLIADRETVPF